MELKKDRFYRIKVKQHRLESVCGKTFIAKFNGINFWVNWGFLPLIIESSKVEVLHECGAEGSKIIQAGLFDGKSR